MRSTRAAAVVAAILLVGAPPAVAHEGNPNFRSEITGIAPAADGLTVDVLNFDDSLRLTNDSGKDVVITGYEDEPYARIAADGTVELNRNSTAYYLNDDRFAEAEVPAGIDPADPPDWERVDGSGTLTWHDHRAHWMSTSVPPQVTDESAATKIFDYSIPIEVGGEARRDRGDAHLGREGLQHPRGSLHRPRRRRDRRRRFHRRPPAAGPKPGRAGRRGGGLVTARRLIAAALAAIALAAAGPAPALGHAVLERTVPERGADLGEPPEAIELYFNEPIEASFGAVRVFDASGGQVDTGELSRPGGDSAAIGVALPPIWATGPTRPRTGVVSADSHPISGGFVFSVGDPGAAPAASVSDLLADS